MLRLPLALILLSACAASAAEGPDKAWPPWDGVESVEQYAKKVNLPPTQSLDLGNGVKLDLVLIPAGKFMMGTPEPTPVDEDGFQRKIVTGQALLAAAIGTLLVLLCAVAIQAIRRKQRPKFSLLRLMAITGVGGVAVLSGLHWRQSAHALGAARLEYQAAKRRFEIASQEDKPAHAVTFPEPFYMAKFLTTQEQYQQVKGANPSSFKSSKDHPVDSVCWTDAQEFCKKVSEFTKQNVRLPTESEWEYSCRAGSATTYYSGDAEKDLDCVAWYHGNSNGTTHPVGQKAPNAFGLYDMHGNLWQWCQDWWKRDIYTDDYRVLRGGSWGSDPFHCRSTLRAGLDPNHYTRDLGFRVVGLSFKTQ
jgi:formylglycine-generating enzyme required for sulfatase activity